MTEEHPLPGPIEPAPGEAPQAPDAAILATWQAFIGARLRHVDEWLTPEKPRPWEVLEEPLLTEQEDELAQHITTESRTLSGNNQGARLGDFAAIAGSALLEAVPEASVLGVTADCTVHITVRPDAQLPLVAFDTIEHSIEPASEGSGLVGVEKRHQFWFGPDDNAYNQYCNEQLEALGYPDPNSPEYEDPDPLRYVGPMDLLCQKFMTHTPLQMQGEDDIFRALGQPQEVAAERIVLTEERCQVLSAIAARLGDSPQSGYQPR